RGMRALDAGLIAALVVVAIQIVPLPTSLIRGVEPLHETVRGLLGRKLGTLSRLTVDAWATAADVVLGVSYLLLFWTARSLYRRGGLRISIRSIAVVGIALSLLVVVQR